MEKIKFPWGELTIVGTTKELSVGIDTIYPSAQTDSKNAYLKKGVAIYYVVKGQGLLANRPIKTGDLLKIKSGQKINLTNNTENNLVVITTYLPPYDEKNIGHK